MIIANANGGVSISKLTLDFCDSHAWMLALKIGWCLISTETSVDVLSYVWFQLLSVNWNDASFPQQIILKEEKSRSHEGKINNLLL